MRRTVVVIHGVGYTSPAEIGRIVGATLGWRTRQQTTVLHKDTSFEEFTNASGDRILEVHWADLMRPRATLFGILRHSWFLVTSMVDVAVGRTRCWLSGVMRLYRFMVFPTLLGTAALVMATATAVAVTDDDTRQVMLVTLLVASIAGTWYARRFGTGYASLWIWVVGIAAALGLSWQNELLARHPLVVLALKARELGFAIAVGSMTVATIILWRSKKAFVGDVPYAMMSLLYLPFIAMNSLMAWASLLALALLRKVGPKYRAWEGVAYPDFDLKTFELCATVAFSGLAFLFLWCAFERYQEGQKRERAGASPDCQFPAVGARDGAADFLRLAPVVLAVLGLLAVAIEAWTVRRDTDTDIIAIYQMSILRTLPFLAWLLGPFALVADVAGDILFYLQPRANHPAAIGSLAKRRLADVYEYACETAGADGQVVVLAHSQGSKIAADLRADGVLTSPLVTCGSPVDSLYERFLGDVATRAPSPAAWINAFRSRDYIGGNIAAASDNTSIGAGGHTEYWSDSSLGRLLDVACRAPVPPVAEPGST